jgi:hypothetical protein
LRILYSLPGAFKKRSSPAIIANANRLGMAVARRGGAPSGVPSRVLFLAKDLYNKSKAFEHKSFYQKIYIPCFEYLILTRLSYKKK